MAGDRGDQLAEVVLDIGIIDLVPEVVDAARDRRRALAEVGRHAPAGEPIGQDPDAAEVADEHPDRGAVVEADDRHAVLEVPLQRDPVAGHQGQETRHRDIGIATR